MIDSLKFMFSTIECHNASRKRLNQILLIVFDSIAFPITIDKTYMKMHLDGF